MIRVIAMMMLVIGVVLAVVGCAAYGGHGYGDGSATYSAGGTAGGGCH